MIAYIIVFNVICVLAHKLLAPYGVQASVMSEESLKERELTVKGDQAKSGQVEIEMLPQVDCTIPVQCVQYAFARYTYDCTTLVAAPGLAVLVCCSVLWSGAACCICAYAWMCQAIRNEQQRCLQQCFSTGVTKVQQVDWFSCHPSGRL